jgi:hypothetical protein
MEVLRRWPLGRIVALGNGLLLVRVEPDRAILEVVQRGYRRGAKIIRPAKVVVNDLTQSNQGRHAC